MPLTQLPLLLALAMAPLQFLPEVPDTTLILGAVSRRRLAAGVRPQRAGTGTPLAGQPADHAGGRGFLAADAAGRVPGGDGGEPVGRLARGGAPAGRERPGSIRCSRAAGGSCWRARRWSVAPTPRRWRTRSPLPGAATPSPRASGSSCSPPRSTGWTRATAPPPATSVPRRSLPLVSDWILLRAAAVTDDSAGRALIYQRIAGPQPRGRIGWTEAAAHQRIGDLDGAARRYACPRRAAHAPSGSASR